MNLKNLLKFIAGTLVSIVAVGMILKNTNKQKNEITSQETAQKLNEKSESDKEEQETSQSIYTEEIFETINNEEEKLIETKSNVMSSMSERHKNAVDMMEESLSNIMHEETKSETVSSYTQQDLDNMDDEMDKLLQ